MCEYIYLPSSFTPLLYLLKNLHLCERKITTSHPLSSSTYIYAFLLFHYARKTPGKERLCCYGWCNGNYPIGTRALSLHLSRFLPHALEKNAGECIPCESCVAYIYPALRCLSHQNIRYSVHILDSPMLRYCCRTTGKYTPSYIYMAI